MSATLFVAKIGRAAARHITRWRAFGLPRPSSARIPRSWYGSACQGMVSICQRNHDVGSSRLDEGGPEEGRRYCTGIQALVTGGADSCSPLAVER